MHVIVAINKGHVFQIESIGYFEISKPNSWGDIFLLKNSNNSAASPLLRILFNRTTGSVVRVTAPEFRSRLALLLPVEFERDSHLFEIGEEDADIEDNEGSILCLLGIGSSTSNSCLGVCIGDIFGVCVCNKLMIVVSCDPNPISLFSTEFSHLFKTFCWSRSLSRDGFLLSIKEVSYFFEETLDDIGFRIFSMGTFVDDFEGDSPPATL